MRQYLKAVPGLLAFLIAGCGGGDDSSGTSGGAGTGGTGGDAGNVEPDAFPDVIGPGNCVDGDGDGRPGLTEECPGGTDCDDTDPFVHPGMLERCDDDVDNDCDGEVDEEDCVSCDPGERVACYTGPSGTSGVGACRPGVGVCNEEGFVTSCEAEVTPGEEINLAECDYVDNDCDGEVDEDLRNACLVCGEPTPTEVCGDGVDNDCNGQTDEGCDCDFACVCPPVGPCECNPPTNQPCYEGPFGTSGVGVCVGGRRDCRDDLGTAAPVWGECLGQVIPQAECANGEANGLDDDCNGLVDDGCRDADGDDSPWPLDCDDEDDAVHPGAPEECNDRDDDCDGVADEGVTNACGGCYEVTAEECDNGYDDDCDGQIDESCQCISGSQQDCYGGPPGTEGVAACKAGPQQCDGKEFGKWGACEGQVLPTPEVCDGIDNDCDGEVDERWAAGSNPCGFCDGEEVCDGLDNDCDGLVDENVANKCGECGPEPQEVCNGLDDDCDGVVDDGVTNACGTCPPEPCYDESWDTPADCDPTVGTDCNSVEEHPDYPGSVTLGQIEWESHYIYIAVTNKNQVAQLDTDTGVKNWQVDSGGCQPSRTSVAEDGSVWVGNRGHNGCDPNNVNHSNLVHLDRNDGHIICRADIPGLVRGVAIDASGDVWAGTWNAATLYRVSGTNVDTSQSPPRCQILGSYPLGVNIYGLTVDPSGNVWTSSSPTVRFNIATSTFETFPNPSYYGIAPDGVGRVWFGGWSGGGTIHALDLAGAQSLNTTIANVTAVTVHPNGTIWGSSYGTNQIVGYDPNTQQAICTAPIPSGANPHGIAVDRQGRLWTPSRFNSGSVNVFDTSCNFVATYVVDAGQELYSYSDMTGHLLQNFTNPNGKWTQVFDSGYANPYWNRIEWDADVPPNTGISMEVRASNNGTDFAGSQVCGPFTASPGMLDACPFLNSNRYLQVVATLTTSEPGARPILHGVRAYWAY